MLRNVIHQFTLTTAQSQQVTLVIRFASVWSLQELWRTCVYVVLWQTMACLLVKRGPHEHWLIIYLVLIQLYSDQARMYRLWALSCAGGSTFLRWYGGSLVQLDASFSEHC